MLVNFNVVYAVVIATAVGFGVLVGRSWGSNAMRTEVAKAVTEQRELAIKAGVGQYIVDPLTGSTGFTYASTSPK